MKQSLKVAVTKRSIQEKKAGEHDVELKKTLERLKKKGFNPMQMCHKLLEHEEPAPENQSWSYDLVVSECKRLKILQ